MLQRARQSVSTEGGATVFGYYVNNPAAYGIVEFDPQGTVISIEEEPKNQSPITPSQDFTSTITRW